MIDFLDEGEQETGRIEFFKDCGETRIVGQTQLTAPPWDWGSR
jgi:hypothetical protein